MRILIELDDKTYNTLFPKEPTEMSNKKSMYWLLKLHSAVCKGTILPAGHGRLKDVDAFIKAECSQCDGYCDICDCNFLNCKSDYRCEFIKDLDNADIIIEADK